MNFHLNQLVKLQLAWLTHDLVELTHSQQNSNPIYFLKTSNLKSPSPPLLRHLYELSISLWSFAPPLTLQNCLCLPFPIWNFVSFYYGLAARMQLMEIKRIMIGMLVFEVKGCGYNTRSFWWGCYCFDKMKKIITWLRWRKIGGSDWEGRRWYLDNVKGKKKLCFEETSFICWKFFGWIKWDEFFNGGGRKVEHEDVRNFCIFILMFMKF